MDEFVKATPSVRRIVEYLRDLKPFEHLDIKVNETGEVDTFIIVRSTKVIVKQGQLKYIK